MNDTIRVCSVCQGCEDLGSVGDDDPVTRFPVCRTCHESGRYERWRLAAIAEIRGSNLGFVSNGNLADDLRQVRAYLKHDSRIEDGVCPNGCALMVWDDERHANCPVCHFAFVKSSL